MTQYRQGDVLLTKVEKATGTESERGRRIVLAYGEATGHHHAVEGIDMALLVDGARRFLKLKDKATLRHEEHAPLQLLRGTYEITIQREYDPTVRSRTVLD
jgi:hypothetical protein